MKQKFNYVQKKVRPEDLKQFELLKVFNPRAIDDFYLNEAKYFNHLDLPVIDKNKNILANWQAVDAAVQLKLKTIDVIECQNIEGEDILRFINFKGYLNTKDYAHIAEVIKVFDKLLEKGTSSWLKDLPGDKDDKISVVVGYKPGMIKQIRVISKNECQFKMLQSGQITHTEAYNASKKSSYKIPAPKAVKPGKRCNEKPFDLNELSFKTSENDKYSFKLIGKDKAEVFHNGRKLKPCRYFVQSYEEDTVFQLSPKDSAPVIQLRIFKTKVA